jgi:hypothetical protein
VFEAPISAVTSPERRPDSRRRGIVVDVLLGLFVGCGSVLTASAVTAAVVLFDGPLPMRLLAFPVSLLITGYLIARFLRMRCALIYAILALVASVFSLPAFVSFGFFHDWSWAVGIGDTVIILDPIAAILVWLLFALKNYASRIEDSYD